MRSRAALGRETRSADPEEELHKKNTEDQHFLPPIFSPSATFTRGSIVTMPSKLASIPQAQLPTAYRDVIKLALRPRQSRAFTLAATAWHVFLTSALLRTPLSLMSPLTLLVSLVSFGLGIMPLLARRKRSAAKATTPPTRLPSSKADQLTTALKDPITLGLITQHTIAFVVLALGYAALLTAKGGSWGPQVWVESHGSFYLNERFLFLLGHSSILAVVYTIFFRLLPSPSFASTPLFDPITLTNPSITIKTRVVNLFTSRIPSTALLALLTSLISTTFYSLIRIRLWTAVLLLTGTRSFVRRLFVPSFRVEFGIFEVALRSTLFSVAAVCAVETSYLLLDVYLTHPLAPVSKLAKNPNKLLLDGLEEKVLFFQNHALGELARLGLGDKEAREGIYRDVNAEPAWGRVRDRCLGLLAEQKDFIVRRGVVPTTQAKAVPQQKPTAQPVKSTIWDQLAAGSTSTPSQTTPSTATPATTPSAATAKPALLSTTTIQSALTTILSTLWKALPSDAKHVLFPPRRRRYLLLPSPSSLVSLISRDAARTISSTHILKSLLIHSLNEDPYGTVQKDIKRILTALVDLDCEVRRLGMELEQQAIATDKDLQEKSEGEGGKKDMSEAASSKGETSEELRREWRRSGAEEVERVLTGSIREVLDTFGGFDLGLGSELEVRLGECLS